ncbi:hypothetical protein D9M72_573890 [compost metagenome]
MKLGISTRQIDHIRRRVGTFVGKRREKGDFRRGAAPAEQEVLVAKGEGHIPCHRDMLAERLEPDDLGHHPFGL